MLLYAVQTPFFGMTKKMMVKSQKLTMLYEEVHVILLSVFISLDLGSTS